MVSNALSPRRSQPRPPTVCIPPPKDPPYPLIMDIWVNPWIVTIEHAAEVTWFGDHAARSKGEKVESVWDPGTGNFRKTPLTYNRQVEYGIWIAPPYPGRTQITVKCTWGDGTVAFAYRDVYVVPHFP